MNSQILLVTSLLAGLSASGQTLYDINFNVPDQSVNALVVTGAAPQYISQIVFGSPTVVSSFGVLTDQPLRLDMIKNPAPFYYDQVQLDFDYLHLTTLDVSFDFTSAGLIGSNGHLAVLLDAYTVQSIDFENNGRISLISRSDGGAFQATDIGGFTDGEAFRFQAHVDTMHSQWTAYKDGVILGQSPFNPDGDLWSIRFSYGTRSSDAPSDASAVGIDNIVVTVPEPAHLTEYAVGLGLMWLRFRKR